MFQYGFGLLTVSTKVRDRVCPSKVGLLGSICVCLLIIKDSERFGGTGNKVIITMFLG